MDAQIVQVKGITFMGKGKSGHWVAMDGPAKVEGNDGATAPKELVLIALGGCTGMDVVSILKKMRENVSRFEIDIDAESEEEKHPKVYTKVHITYKLWGETLKKVVVEKAISLSQENSILISLARAFISQTWTAIWTTSCT